MATIRKRGKTYQIRVSTGYDALYRQVVRTKTWKPKPGMSDKQIEAELNKQAVMFEELCTRGIVPSNMKFRSLQRNGLTNMQSSISRNPRYSGSEG